ncbi:MAG: hypothetical protein EZS28_018506 [Streblomastix strix]|uniref:Uncharacterized protein n=1 Tax=Streblomastix strix TaxID=222440 RepID=A0A5J4VTN1_9EUKA|nr:MAG: hypothetical protein EZS28_018506 [Streblomastix strix]
MSEFDFKQIEKEVSEEFDAEKSQSAGGAGGMMEIDGIEDDYDYQKSQAARYDRMKSRTKPFGKQPFHPSVIQRTKKLGGQKFREELEDVLATLVGYLNRDTQKINRLSSAVSAHKYIKDKYLGKRFRVSEQNLDGIQVTPDNVVVYDKKNKLQRILVRYLIWPSK